MENHADRWEVRQALEEAPARAAGIPTLWPSGPTTTPCGFPTAPWSASRDPSIQLVLTPDGGPAHPGRPGRRGGADAASGLQNGPGHGAAHQRIDLQAPQERETYEELRPLVQRIGLQNRQLREQMEHLSQEHEEQDASAGNYRQCLPRAENPADLHLRLCRDHPGRLVRSEDVPRFAGNIYKEARRLITLVGDIIKITQMDDKQLPIQREQLDLRRCAPM
mgnify:CR=1 FL=1